MKRLREAFLIACKQAEQGDVMLPLEFHYEEPESIGERFYFRLWDKPSFVCYHKETFTKYIVDSAQKRTGTYSKANNHYFVEFLKAERLEDDDVAEGLWFTEILQGDVLGNWSTNETEIERKRELLFSWGYGEEGTKQSCPFLLYAQRGFISKHLCFSSQR